MTREDPDGRLADLFDHHELEQLQARYADVVTRRSWGELADLFVPDMPLTLDTGRGEALLLTGATSIGEFIDSAVARFSFFEFVPLNTVIDLRPGGDHDLATARLWMCEQRCAVAEDGADGEWSTAFGLYRDTYRRIDGRWRFAERDYRSLARDGPEAAVLPFPDLG